MPFGVKWKVRSRQPRLSHARELPLSSRSSCSIHVDCMCVEISFACTSSPQPSVTGGLHAARALGVASHLLYRCVLSTFIEASTRSVSIL